VLLEVHDVAVHYGKIAALKDVSLAVDEGEIVALIGANGAGKTTTLKTISGLRPLSHGQVVFEGKDISKMAGHKRVTAGIGQAPEGRGVFPGMTVQENLLMGSYSRKGKVDNDLEEVYALFPRLAERKTQYGGTMSGGEQQMIAIGRALMAKPGCCCSTSVHGAGPIWSSRSSTSSSRSTTRHDGAAGRAERPAGAAAGAPGVRAGDRAGGQVRPGGRPPRRPPGPGRLPRRRPRARLTANPSRTTLRDRLRRS
jgi:predicted ABC-type transport system involved in lysophospholipase L1 biosynthesis ATPase subunit